MGKYLDLRFDTVESSLHLQQLSDFMRSNPGTYNPDEHMRWIEEVCIPGIESGERRALAWFQNGRIVGDAVLKIESNLPNCVEIKNFRTLKLEKSNGNGIKHIGDFMMTQALSEATELLVEQGKLTSEADVITVKLDTTEGNPAVTFFQKYGFRESGKAELYTPGQVEILMTLDLVVA